MLYYRVGSIKARLTNPQTNGYEAYGARGITLHPEWGANPMLMVNYLLSLPGYKEGKTIDRIDNDVGYVPGNLRWATAKEQSSNRRNNVWVEWRDVKMLLQDFIKQHTDLSASQGRKLYKKGWTPEQLHKHVPHLIGARVRFVELRTKKKIRRTRDK